MNQEQVSTMQLVPKVLVLAKQLALETQGEKKPWENKWDKGPWDKGHWSNRK